jgi:hypothetical protein
MAWSTVGIVWVLVNRTPVLVPWELEMVTRPDEASSGTTKTIFWSDQDWISDGGGISPAMVRVPSLSVLPK